MILCYLKEDLQIYFCMSIGQFNATFDFVRAFFTTSGLIMVTTCGFSSFFGKSRVSEVVVGAVGGGVEGGGRGAEQLVFDYEVDLALESVDVVLVQRLQPRLPVVVEGAHGLTTQLRLRVQPLGRLRDAPLLRRGQVSHSLETDCLGLGARRESLVVEECEHSLLAHEHL